MNKTAPPNTSTLIAKHAINLPEMNAIIDAGTGRSISYAELDDLSIRCAKGLLAEGLDFGDNIAIVAENLPETLIIAWSAMRIGLHVTPVNWHLSAEEAIYIIKDCNARLIVVSPETKDLASQIDDEIDKSIARWAISSEIHGYRLLDSVFTDYSSEPLKEELQGAMMFYSSGTTGHPKGILHQLERQAPDSQPDVLLPLLEGLYGFNSETVYLCPAPLYHAAPIGWSMGVHRLGGTVVLMRNFDPEDTLEYIQKYQINRAQFVPTMFIRMLKLPESVRSAYDVSSLEVVIHAAAPCPIEIKQAMLDWWGPIIYEYYSGSEGVGFCAIDPQEWLSHPGSVGKAVAGIPHVLDNEEEELPSGEVGTLYFDSGPGFSYHGDPEKTANAHSKQGWCTLGDIGYMDEEGYIYLTDRKSNMIISGGVNIYPQEAENILSSHPQVLDIAVIGVPNPDYGEEVKAVIQLVDQSLASPDLEQDILAYCQARLSRFKCPRSVDFVSNLPRLPNGKLLKRKLRDTYWADGNK